MLFNSLQFLLFFPVVTILFFVLPQKLRIPLLLVASCIFYAAWIPAYLLVLFLVIAIDFIAAQRIEASTGKTRTLFLIASLTANLGLLWLFKYFDFLAETVNSICGIANTPQALPILNLILPIGLSFHTFQALAYTIEVYRGRQKAERNLANYALYVLFYPQLVAGPIERPQHLLPQFTSLKGFDYERVCHGLQLMLWGFFKKLVLADRLGILVNQVYGDPTAFTGLPLLFATYCFAYQIYCDFSGYTDIARGAAKVMGFNLVINFDSPYAASNPQDFWRRWHISLSTWFRDYLYIPLGGGRNGTLRQFRNLFIVFLLSGLWHGDNWTYAAWGLVHGAYLSIYLLIKNLLQKKHTGENTAEGSPLWKFCAWFITFNAVCFAWIFFRANSLADAWYIVTHSFSPSSADISAIGLSRSELLIAGGGIVFLELVQYIQRRTSVARIIDSKPVALRWAIYYAAIFVVLLFGKFSAKQFIYFQF